MNPATSSPEHVEVESYSQGAPSQEPSAGDFDISLSLPATIEVRMVDASALSDYEIWFFWSSAIMTILSGFLVAYTQESDPHAGKILGVVSVIFAAFFACCFVMTLIKRHTMRKKGRTIRLKTSRIGQMTSK